MIVTASRGSVVPAAERPTAEARGYRVIDYRWDPVLLQRWAVLQDALHPERPLLSERVETAEAGLRPTATAAAVPAATRPAAPVVHAGDLITLWSEDGNVRLQLGAVAQQNAALGERVQMRVTGAGVNGSTGWQAAGVVRGPGSVEMDR